MKLFFRSQTLIFTKYIIYVDRFLRKVAFLAAMTVTFVPPRTFIRRAAPTTIITANTSYTAEIEDRDEDEDLDGDIEMGGMDEHGGGSLLTRKLVVPGQLVTDDPQFMRYNKLILLQSYV